MRLLRVAALAALVGAAFACGSNFSTELTVDTSQVRADPLFDISPTGASVVREPYLVGTDQSYGYVKTWQPVSDEAFLEVLRTSTDMETVFSTALCLHDLDDQHADLYDFVRLAGSRVSGEYRTRVEATLKDGLLRLEIGGRNGTPKIDPAVPVAPFAERLAEASPITSKTCDAAELEELSRHVR